MTLTRFAFVSLFCLSACSPAATTAPAAAERAEPVVAPAPPPPALVEIFVADRDLAALPGVTCSIAIPGRDEEVVVISNASGRAEVLVPNGGTLAVTCSLEGFATSVLTGVPVEAGRRYWMAPLVLRLANGDDVNRVAWADWNRRREVVSAPLARPAIALLTASLPERFERARVHLSNGTSEILTMVDEYEGLRVWLPAPGRWTLRIFDYDWGVLVVSELEVKTGHRTSFELDEDDEFFEKAVEAAQKARQKEDPGLRVAITWAQLQADYEDNAVTPLGG